MNSEYDEICFFLLKIFFSRLLKVLDENLRHHTANYNRLLKQLNDLRQYSSSDGLRILNEEQTSIETRWTQLNRLITDKVRNTILYIRKKEMT